jgi:signal transduction histidine kinase
MILLVGTINVIIFYQADQTAEGTLQILSDNKGRFPDFKPDKLPPRDLKPGFEMNEETRFQTRYFLIELDEAGTVMEIDTSHISAVTSADALEYANAILETGKSGGYSGIYKYKVVDTISGSMVIFLDCRREIQMAMYFLLTSCAVALGTLLLVFILVSVFSKKAINPIIDNVEKQKQFITDAGHEIKTPLAIISANADVLELTNGESEWISSIRNQTTRLDKLVKNLLTLSRMDEGNLVITYHEFDLSRCVTMIAGSFTAVAESQNKNLSIQIQTGLKLHGDEGCMEQLVSTLLDNAMKYSNEKGIVRISLSAYKKGVKLDVYNTVEQIETKNLHRLFDRFYRVDGSRSRETGGYGIGLSIAKSIVEAHQGKISAHSEDGRSICFTVLV